jgi:hypothetical protein
MPERIILPAPSPEEESRQLAEVVADLHYVMATVVEGGGELVPGEAVAELESAWGSSEVTIRQLAVNLVPPNSVFPVTPETAPTPIPHTTLVSADLAGPVGQAKRNALQRLKDRFFMFWRSVPRTEEKREKAAEAACDCLELGSKVVSSIPGYEKVVELIELVRHFVGQRSKRGV